MGAMYKLSEKTAKNRKIASRSVLFSCAIASMLLTGCTLRPTPITPTQMEKMAAADQKMLSASQKPVTKSITLYDAMARAIKYNLKHRLSRMEEALSDKKITSAAWDTLPRLAAQAGYAYRNPLSASVSRALNTGVTSTDYFTSQDRGSTISDLTFTWNLLDFGVSYFQARQESDLALIASENRRKSLHNLMEEVRYAYWKAVGAQQLGDETEAVINTAKKALHLARSVEQENLRSPINSLRYQLDLMNAIRQLGKIRAELLMARTDLALLINLPPTAGFRLEDTSGDAKPEPLLNLAIGEMEKMALTLRPELRVEHYQNRIDVAETRKAMLRTLPGVALNLGQNFDSNSFLLFQNWTQAGAQLTWNIVDILAADDRIQKTKSQEAVGKTRRLALNMAVLSQVHIAYLQYQSIRNELQQTINLRNTQNRLLDHVGKRAEHELDSQLAFVSDAIDTTIARINLYQVYARYQNAKGRLHTTLGLNPGYADNESANLNDLSLEIRQNSQRWQQAFHIQHEAIDSKKVKTPINFNFPIQFTPAEKADTNKKRVATPFETNKSIPVIPQDSEQQKPIMPIAGGIVSGEQAPEQIDYKTLPLIPIVVPQASQPIATTNPQAVMATERDLVQEARQPTKLENHTGTNSTNSMVASVQDSLLSSHESWLREYASIYPLLPEQKPVANRIIREKISTGIVTTAIVVPSYADTSTNQQSRDRDCCQKQQPLVLSHTL